MRLPNLKTAWKEAKETHKKMKLLVEQVKDYDAAHMKATDLLEIKIRSRKIKDQEERRSVRYRASNEIFPKTMEKSATKKDTIKFETMTVPVLDTKLNN